MEDFTNKKSWILVVILLVLFVGLHLPALHFPYHQDEYKWVFYSHPEITPPGTVPHPPLTEFIYTKIGPVLGDLNFRFIPFFFGILNFFLIFYLAKVIFDKRTAFWATFLFSISFYSLLATLMVDVDGAIMPFFFLILSISYFELKKRDFRSKLWWMLLLVGAIGGFMIKVSAVLPIVAVFLDFLIQKEVFSDYKKILKYALYALGGVCFLVLLLVLAKFVFPFFNLEYSVGYWEHFWNSSSFLGRSWFQTFIQFFKSILYTSPLLVLPAFLADKELFKKTRVFYLFIFLGLFFYLVALDFSIGALDRYFQFLVIPLSIISGAIFAKFFESLGKIKKTHIFSLILVIIILFLVQFISHFVPSLHPKTEWLARVFHFKWNFLYPFSGGSGPLGFYMSFLFMALSWIISIFFVLIYFFQPHFRRIIFISIFSIGLLYNFVFTEEYLLGKINGSAPKVLAGAVEFIKNDSNIKLVTVYNDNGGYEIQALGKYRKRLYTDPKFDAEVKMATLNKYKEFYLEVNIPRIDPQSFYRRYLDSCAVIYEKTDKSISAKVYDCTKAPDVKF